MKIHVFVATTQGLVAIQKVYAQDPDIHSVVSINGTSSVAPISCAYHQFVKKGAGIIEADFGGSAYRININGNIDSGESWQLGFYLAHAAHAVGALGDGNLQKGDIAICASGAINTSEKTVLAVEQLSIKAQRAKQHIASWPHDIEVCYLFPKANQNQAEAFSSTSQAPVKTHWLASLHELNALFPQLNAPSELKHQYKTQLTARHAIRLGWLIVVVMAIVVTAFNWLKNNKPPAEANVFAENAAPDSVAHYERIISANHSVSPSETLPASDLLQLNYSQNCAEGEKKQVILRAQSGIFLPAPYGQLCDITFKTQNNRDMVIAINIDSHRYVVSQASPTGYTIPLPSEAAAYLIVATHPALSISEQKSLHAYLFNLADDYQLSTQDITHLSLLASYQVSVFSHQLSE